MTPHVFWLALVAALVALTGRSYLQLLAPFVGAVPAVPALVTASGPSAFISTATSFQLSDPESFSTSGLLTTSQSSSTLGSSSTSVSSSTSGIVGSSSTQGQAHHFFVIGCVLGGFALTVLTSAMILVRRSWKKGTGSIEAVVASALNQYRPQGRHDDVTMSDAHLLWDNYGYNENRASGISTISHDPIHSRNLANSSAMLVPIRREHQPPHAHGTKNRDELRAVRQSEIDRRLQAVRREMDDLTLSLETASETSSSRPRSSLAGEVGRQEMEESETEVLHAQIRQLRAQIEQLQMERSSDWGQGLSDDPPPAYSLL